MTELMEKYLAEASAVYESTSMKVTALMDAAGRQLTINHNEAELKVMKESGTDDDLHYLYEEADKSFVETAVKAIKKIQESIAKFFADLRDKILTMLSEKDAKGTLNKIETKVKMLPLVGRKKVPIEDIEAADKACDEAEASLAKLAAKKKAGQNVTSEDVAEVEKSFLEKHGKAIGAGAAILITASALIVALKKHVGSMNSETKAIEASTSRDLAAYTTLAEKANDPKDVSFWQAISRARARVGKEKGNNKFRWFSNGMNAIKKVLGMKFTNENSDTEQRVRGHKGMPVITPKQESVETPALEETEDQAAASSQQKVEDMVSDEVKEEGPVETAPAATDPIDSLDKVDVWSSVMNDLDGSAEECSGSGCASTECNENATDTFDTLYKKIFGDAAPNPSDDAAITGGKPNNDKMIADLYKDVMAEVKGKNPEVKPVEPLKEGIAKESTFDALMKEISELV